MLSLFGVVPVLVGPLQTLLALLPSLLMGLGTLILVLFKPATLKRLLMLLWTQKLSVAALAGAAVGSVYLYRAIFPPAVDAVSASIVGSGGWPMFRGGPERRGAAPGALDPIQGGVHWSFARDGMKTYYSSPAVVGSRVYAAAADYGPLRDRGSISSIDADSGKLVWEYKDGGYRATFSSPAVSGKYLVCGEGLHYTRDARIVCLDVERSEAERRGVKLWEFRTKSHVESSPCIADGKVFIGAGDDGYYCLALEPDAQGQPVVLWHIEGRDVPDAESAPLYHEGKLYFGLGEGGKAICCVDAANGKDVWRLTAPYPVFGCPAISGGKLYIGMGNGNYVESAEQVAAKQIEKLTKAGKTPAEIAAIAEELRPGGEVWCIDLASQKVVWKYATAKTILGAVALSGERLYFGSTDGHLYCLSAQGQLLRKWNARAPIIGSPAVGQRHIVIATQTGHLYCLEENAFQIVWEARVDSGGQLFSSPALAHGRVYLGTATNGLLCVGEAKGRSEPLIWAGHLGGGGKSGWIDGSLLASRGVFAWRYPAAKEDQPEEGAEPEIPRILAPAAHVGREAFVGLNSSNRHGLACLSLGSPVSAEPKLKWLAPTDKPISLSAAASEEAVWCVDGVPGDSGRQLYCFDSRTGARRWQRPVASDASGRLLLMSQNLIAADSAAGLTCFDLSGKEMWSSSVGLCELDPLLIGHLLVVAVNRPPALAALDAPTGRILWKTELDGGPLSGPVAAGDRRIWLAMAAGVEAFDLVDGRRTAAIACGPIPGRLVSAGNRLAGINRAKEVVVIDPIQEKELLRLAGARDDLPPLLMGDALLYVDQRSIQHYDLAARKASRWMDIAWLGGATAPMTVVDSHVVVATKRGLVCVKPNK